MIESRFVKRFLLIAALAIGPASLDAGFAAEPNAGQSVAKPEPLARDPSVAAVWKLITARAPSVQRGAEIAAKGLGDSVPACGQCHAQNGAADISDAFPRIAGQPTFYLVKQLLAYASGERSNDIMSPFAKGLSPDDALDVAAHYANSSATSLPPPDVDAALYERGKALATVGDEGTNIQACDNCHGPGGRGEPPVIPYLAGQYASYTTAQLDAWRGGSRKTNPDTMLDIAKRLSASDSAALAAYFQNVFTTTVATPKAK